MWVRGLKRRQLLRYVRRPAVVPRVGAWIETNIALTKTNGISATVVPRVGAWIETNLQTLLLQSAWVVPRVGAWIETSVTSSFIASKTVVPRVGAWIETRRFRRIIPDVMVVPRVGAWIETMLPGNNTTFTMWSYPVWVRGLKQRFYFW